jgi:ElaB/YqjD/DUF883 family membrane-anchored ribosome-binding protein
MPEISKSGGDSKGRAESTPITNKSVNVGAVQGRDRSEQIRKQIKELTDELKETEKEQRSVAKTPFRERLTRITSYIDNNVQKGMVVGAVVGILASVSTAIETGTPLVTAAPIVVGCAAVGILTVAGYRLIMNLVDDKKS